MAGGTLCTASGAAMGARWSPFLSWQTPSSSTGMHTHPASPCRLLCVHVLSSPVRRETNIRLSCRCEDPIVRGCRRPLNDSDAIELYINQYTSATLVSPLVGLSIHLQANFYKGTTASANISFAVLSNAHSSYDSSAEITLKLRIPSWAVSSGVRVEVNGESWADCAAAAGPQAGSFCTVRRRFAAGV